ncbi:hypothetical protein OAG71_01230 [bacterium]|nr:hypothetical protein [bacterium]
MVKLDTNGNFNSSFGNGPVFVPYEDETSVFVNHTATEPQIFFNGSDQFVITGRQVSSSSAFRNSPSLQSLLEAALQFNGSSFDVI